MVYITIAFSGNVISNDTLCLGHNLLMYNYNNPLTHLSDYWKYCNRFRFSHASKLILHMEELVNEDFELITYNL